MKILKSIAIVSIATLSLWVIKLVIRYEYIDFLNFLILPAGWVTIYEKAQDAISICAQSVWGDVYGFPFGFISYGGINLCQKVLKVNFLVLFIDIAVIYGIIVLIGKKKTEG